MGWRLNPTKKPRILHHFFVGDLSQAPLGLSPASMVLRVRIRSLGCMTILTCPSAPNLPSLPMPGLYGEESCSPLVTLGLRLVAGLADGGAGRTMGKAGDLALCGHHPSSPGPRS